MPIESQPREFVDLENQAVAELALSDTSEEDGLSCRAEHRIFARSGFSKALETCQWIVSISAYPSDDSSLPTVTSQPVPVVEAGPADRRSAA